MNLTIEIFGTLVAILTALGGICIKWIHGEIASESKARADAANLLEAKIGAKLDAVTHKANNTATRVDSLEHFRIADIERVVKLETTVMALSDPQKRIEHMIEKQGEENARGRAETIETIREISRRDLKP